MRSILSISNPSMKLDGFEIHNVLSDLQLNNITVDLYNRLKLQAYKIGLVQDKLFYNYGIETDTKNIDELVVSLNQKNKISVDFAIQELRECPSFYKLINQEFLSICSELLECPIPLLKIHFDGILLNIPSNKQRLYRFHSEAHYYPYRKNFLNFWVPIIHDKKPENGAMMVKHKGHFRHYDFNEYNGFDKIEGYEILEENYFYQLELPENQISDLETLIADLRVGSGLFFHANLPHSSVLNKSDVPSYALVARVYDYRKDLTLSDKTGIKLYNGAKGGYPGLRPII
jgi:hypothetical protein